MKATVIALLVMLLSACSTQQTTAPEAASAKPADHGSIGMPNPASVNCSNQGGRIDLRKDAAGNVGGICVFPDGRACEEWALFRDHQCVAPKPVKPD